MSSSTVEFWEGDFGDDYTRRNRVNWLERVPFWTDILAKTGAQSIFEMGANVGWNLLALRTVRKLDILDGFEINNLAIQQAGNLGFQLFERWPSILRYDLCFTAGVLIHIGPNELQEKMKQLIGLSNRYILAIEYESEVEEEIDYRGHSGKLWRRPYGKIYQDMGLKLVESGEALGFDRCTYWLLEK